MYNYFYWLENTRQLSQKQLQKQYYNQSQMCITLKWRPLGFSSFFRWQAKTKLAGHLQSQMSYPVFSNQTFASICAQTNRNQKISLL